MVRILSVIFLAIFWVFCVNAEPRKIAVSSLAWEKYSLADMLSDLSQLDISDVSIFEGMIMGIGTLENAPFSHKMDEESMVSAKKIFSAYSVKILCYVHRAAKDEPEMKEIFDFAQFFGVKTVVIREPIENLELYCAYAEKYNIKVGIYCENHDLGGNYSSPDKLMKILKNLPQMNVSPNCGAWAKSKLDLVECVRKLKGKISEICILDMTASGRMVACGRGDLTLESMIAELDKQGFSGYYVVDFNPMASPISTIAPSVAYLRCRPVKKRL